MLPLLLLLCHRFAAGAESFATADCCCRFATAAAVAVAVAVSLPLLLPLLLFRYRCFAAAVAGFDCFVCND